MYKPLRRYMISAIAEEVKHEIDKDIAEFGLFHSLHEGLSALRAEYVDLEQEVFQDYKNGDNTDNVRCQALQVAAVAMRIAMQMSLIPVNVPERTICGYVLRSTTPTQ